MQRQAKQLTHDDLKRAQSGDLKAFKKIYEMYFPFVRFVAGRCGSSGPDVDDVVQESFIRLHKNLSKITAAEQFKSWLAITARNLVFDLKRREKRSVALPHNDMTAPEAALEVMDESDSSWQRELEVALVADFIEALAAEPGGESFVQFYRDGLSAKEIAAKNGEAISTVTTRLSRLRQRFGVRLRDHIEQLRDCRL